MLSAETLAQLRGFPLTFYGHFSGDSSYPVVCKAIARWALSRGIDLKVCNLRTDPVPSWLEPHRVPQDVQSAVWNHAAGSRLAVVAAGLRGGLNVMGDQEAEAGRPDAVGILFGFPQWLPSIPKYRKMIGYHVGDVRPLPPAWFGLIEGRCDVVLTPSGWCQELLHDLELTAPVHVVHHGVDPEVFSPGAGKERDRVTLRHWCSSGVMDRKGTMELLRTLRLLLQEPVGSFPVDATISVPAQALPYAVTYAGQFDGGTIGVFEDVPGSPSRMARVMSMCDTVVQPSRAEGFACIPLESVACGTPVVILGETGDADYVDDLGDAVVKVKPAGWSSCSGGEAPMIDVDSLRDALAAAIVGRDVLKAAALRVSAHVRNVWSWESVLDNELAPVLLSLDGSRSVDVPIWDTLTQGKP